MKNKKQMGFCPKCNSLSHCSYNEKYDAYFCRGCNVWIETTCGDPDCYYCSIRPEKPL